jgi:hypothetical protein
MADSNSNNTQTTEDKTMGLWSKIWGDSNSESDVKVRHTTAESRESKVTADKYTHTGRNESGAKTHVHESYTLDHDKGKYTEYRGGENAPDRSYNKSK